MANENLYEVGASGNGTGGGGVFILFAASL